MLLMMVLILSDSDRTSLIFSQKSTKKLLLRVKSCPEPEQLGPGQSVQMWPRSGPEPVTALDQSGASITRQSGSWPMRGRVCDVKSINGSVRAVRGGRRGQRDHNIASRGRPSLPDPGVHSDTLLILPTNTSWHGFVWSEKMGEHPHDCEAVTTMRQRYSFFEWSVVGVEKVHFHVSECFLQSQLSKS